MSVRGHYLVEPVLGDEKHVATSKVEHSRSTCSREERVREEVRVSCVHVAAYSTGVIDLGRVEW